MIIDRTPYTSHALHEAVEVLHHYKTQSSSKQESHHWVCEVCGLPYCGSAPVACDGCGRSDALISHETPRAEMFHRW